MDDEQAATDAGISAGALAKFLADAPDGAKVRAYEGEVQGVVVEIGAMVELAFWHNDGRVEISQEGRKYWPGDVAAAPVPAPLRG